MNRSATTTILAVSAAAVLALLWGTGLAGAAEPAGHHGAGRHEAMGDGHHHGHAEGKAKKAPKSFDSPPPVGTKATCPVMGTQFEVTDKTQRSEYKGKHYVFCCPGCKPKFDANPKKYQ